MKHLESTPINRFVQAQFYARFPKPSGHTMTAFAVAPPLMSYYPDLSPGLTFCAVSIAGSRIVMGMHFLSDVVAGGIPGALLGYLSRAAI